MMSTLNSARRSLLWALAACTLLLASHGQAEPIPGRQDKLIVQLVTNYLKRAHLSRPEIGDELSKKLFARFLKDLDPSKVYFLKSDVEDFEKYETELDDLLLQGDMSFAYQVYTRFMTRLGERMALINELVAAKHDFTAKEYIPTEFGGIEWAKDNAEIKERWRKRIKFDLLLQRMGPKPVAEDEARKKILSRYQNLHKRWKQVDNYELLELFLVALTASIDPHSGYMSPTTLADFDIAMRLQLEGIGARLRSEDGYATLAEIIPGGPAARDGRLKPKDRIIAVSQGDGQFVDVVDMKLPDAVKLIRGAKGTKVELKVLPAGKLEPIIIALTREKVELKGQEARSEIIEQGKKADGTAFRIGVIELPSFYVDSVAARAGRDGFKSATEDVRKILKEFQTKNVDGVILDLRRNGGGALSEALGLTGLFVDEGPIVQVKGFQGQVERKDDPEKGVVYDGPLMVLISRLSASASEILAGAMQDYGRAVVVGDEATHGKGTVQLVLDLGHQIQADEPPKLGALRLTIQQFYRVNGDSTQLRGVASDVVLPSFTDHLPIMEKDLDNALAFDRVGAAEHEHLNMLSDELKTTLRQRSAERVKASKEFGKLLKQIERYKARQGRKQAPLNEKELKEQYARDDSEKTEEKLEEVLNEPAETEKYKFDRNFVNNEILQVMQDYLQNKKVARSQ